jgi:hypothetical protein
LIFAVFIPVRIPVRIAVVMAVFIPVLIAVFNFAVLSERLAVASLAAAAGSTETLRALTAGFEDGLLLLINDFFTIAMSYPSEEIGKPSTSSNYALAMPNQNCPEGKPQAIENIDK